MAKNKSLKKPKSKALPIESASDRERNPFILAEPIAKQGKLVNILLAEADIKREPNIEDSVINTFTIENIVVGKSEESNILTVTVYFLLRGHAEGKDESYYKVSCKIVLIYQCSDLTTFDKEALDAFAFTTGVFNAWPYWREFVQSMTSRMGLPPIIVPLFKFGQ